MIWAYFMWPMLISPMPFLLLQAVVPLIWFAVVTLVILKYEARGIWIVATAPLAVFGWNAGGVLAFYLMCMNATSC